MAKIVPFGKYKDQPVEALVADRGYCEWLAAQPWFAEKFRDLYQVVINYGAEPQETPAHNRLQAMFLDSEICLRLARLSAPKWFELEAQASAYLEEHEEWREAERHEEPITCRREFEIDGWDVVLQFKGGIRYDRSNYYHEVGIVQKHFGPHPWYSQQAIITVECKPLVGDDYPAVLRQMKRYPDYGIKILLVEVFDARGATLEQVQTMFASSGIKIVMLHEIDKAPWED